MTEIDVSGCCLYKDGICLTDKGKCTSMCDYGAYAREEKLKRLKQENAKLEENMLNMRKGCLKCKYKNAFEENAKLKEALKKIKSIIDNDFINRYMELSFNEYDAILEQIEKICEVLKDENE